MSLVPPSARQMVAILELTGDEPGVVLHALDLCAKSCAAAIKVVEARGLAVPPDLFARSQVAHEIHQRLALDLISRAAMQSLPSDSVAAPGSIPSFPDAARAAVGGPSQGPASASPADAAPRRDWRFWLDLACVGALGLVALAEYLWRRS